MKTRDFLLCCATAVFVLAPQNQASACLRIFRGNGPIGNVARVAIPTMADIQAVPRLRDGRLVNYPLRVVGYGLNIHPGARVVRHVLFR